LGASGAAGGAELPALGDFYDFFNKNNVILGICGRKFLLQNNLLTITELKKDKQIRWAENFCLTMITFIIKHFVMSNIPIFFEKC